MNPDSARVIARLEQERTNRLATAAGETEQTPLTCQPPQPACVCRKTACDDVSRKESGAPVSATGALRQVKGLVRGLLSSRPIAIYLCVYFPPDCTGFSCRCVCRRKARTP